MFKSRHGSSGGSSANRWLIVAGAGLVILAFVARMLLDIGHTKVSDLAAAMRPDTAPSAAAVVTPAAADSEMLAPETEAAPDTTAPVPTPPVAATASASPVARGYAVQIGAFGSEGNATRLSERATGLGYPASVIPQERSASTLYLVRVNGLSSPERARVAADSLARSLRVKSVIIPPSQ